MSAPEDNPADDVQPTKEEWERRCEDAWQAEPPDCAFASPEDRRWELLNNNTAQQLICANCGEVSTNLGQILPGGRWVCTESCRRELCDSQAYDDLAASGGIVDAP